VREMSIDENYERNITPIRSEISRLSRGTVAATKRVHAIFLYGIILFHWGSIGTKVTASTAPSEFKNLKQFWASLVTGLLLLLISGIVLVQVIESGWGVLAFRNRRCGNWRLVNSSCY
jgi:hypothetical protein